MEFDIIDANSDEPTGRLALVFELMDMNVYELIRGRRHYVAEDRVARRERAAALHRPWPPLT